MRRIVLWAMSTVTTVVLLFGYHTSTSGPSAPATAVIAPITSGSLGTSSTTSATTVTGDSVDTRWGTVEVSITVANGKITSVDVPVYPHDNPKDQQINAAALPELIQETLSAQSADIDMVSGATVTSDGYVQSLQAALDKAGL
jgi:uncharacterized protein with FMN-binding domain